MCLEHRGLHDIVIGLLETGKDSGMTTFAFSSWVEVPVEDLGREEWGMEIVLLQCWLRGDRRSVFIGIAWKL